MEDKKDAICEKIAIASKRISLFALEDDSSPLQRSHGETPTSMDLTTDSHSVEHRVA
jgi:hypothetical protein